MPNSHDILLVIGSIAFGMLSAYLSSLYLLRYAETAQERGGKKGKGQQFRPAGKPRRR